MNNIQEGDTLKLAPKPRNLQYKHGNYESAFLKKCYSEIADDRITAMVQSIKDVSFTSSEEEADLVLKQGTMSNQAYELSITPKKIIITSSTSTGCFYGLMTLKQLYAKSIKCCEIIDEPMLEVRGVMLDISRSKVPTLETLFKLVDFFASIKLNHLELYVEGFSFQYKSFERYLGDKNYISIDEYQSLEKYCYNHFIDLVPNENGFGHMDKWLEQEEFKDLRNSPNGVYIWGSNRNPSTLNPLDPRSSVLVKTLYDDMLPYSNSPYFNMDFDEPLELGHDKTLKICEEKGVGDVYLDYAIPLINYVKSYGKKPLMWGDVVVNHPECLSRIPKDLIVVDWGYHKNYDFLSHAKMLQDYKIKYLLAPGTASWGCILGRYDDMVNSIKHSTDACKKYGGMGIIVTDWGDIGHLQYLPVSIPGFLYASLSSWNDSSEAELEESLNNYFSSNISNVILNLSKYTRLEGEYRDYGSRLFSTLLWAENSMRQDNPVEFFKQKMQANLLGMDQITSLRNLFDSSKQLLLGDSLVERELKNSIYLLETLISINIHLASNTKFFFSEDIESLKNYSIVHRQLWNARNKAVGFNFSNKRILWLTEILNSLNGKENI